MYSMRAVVATAGSVALLCATWLLAPDSARAAPARVRPARLGTQTAGEEGGILSKRLQRFALPNRTVTYVERTPEPKQVQANKIFQQGNRKFEKRQLDDAIRNYKQAYEIWPHPIILYNMAINLGFLSNPLAAALKFRKVLQYKTGPISGERYAEAAKHYKRLMGELAVLRVVCTEPGVKVFVDGKPFGSAPLDKTVTLMPGRHMVSASKAKKVPYSAELTLRDGWRYRLKVRLKDFTDVVKTKMVSRYHWYLPTIATSLAAVALSIGGGLWGAGSGEISELKGDLKSNFTPVPGDPVEHDQAREDRAVAFQYAGQVLVGVGLAAAAAAVVLWVLRKKKVSYTVEVSPTKGGAGLNLRF